MVSQEQSGQMVVRSRAVQKCDTRLAPGPAA
jgi:hypothetical protein